MSKEKLLIIFLIIFAVFVFAAVIYFFISSGKPTLEITSPNGEESWEIGQKHEITWKSENIDKVGIVLFNGLEMEWIAKDVDASAGKYEWEIYSGHDYGSGFWIAVFEYPWGEKREVDYSNGAFSITYPELAGCDNLAIDGEWPYLASDFPKVRRVFLTESSYNGDLGGLSGANEICQKEAEALEYEGSWSAFIGGDSDEEVALERIKETERGVDGVFVDATSSASLVRGATCHRLLGKTLDEFLKKLLDPVALNTAKMNEEFLSGLENVWLGRIDSSSDKSCLVAGEDSRIHEKYSLTTTCQNWSKSEEFVEGYSSSGSLNGFPTCYTSSGAPTKAVALGALRLGTTGTRESAVYNPELGGYCNQNKKIMCIEN